MEWIIKIGWAVLLGMMLLILWPQAKRLLTDSPRASSGDWGSALVPIAIVLLFVLLLMQLV